MRQSSLADASVTSNGCRCSYFTLPGIVSGRWSPPSLPRHAGRVCVSGPGHCDGCRCLHAERRFLMRRSLPETFSLLDGRRVVTIVASHRLSGGSQGWWGLSYRACSPSAPSTTHLNHSNPPQPRPLKSPPLWCCRDGAGQGAAGGCRSRLGAGACASGGRRQRGCAMGRAWQRFFSRFLGAFWAIHFLSLAHCDRLVTGQLRCVALRCPRGVDGWKDGGRVGVW